MGRTRTGTVGFNYRDWAGIFYPHGASSRRQLGIYLQHFDSCEFTQYTHQMPDPERMAQLAAQLKGDTKIFVRIHNAFTHTADIGLALNVAKHFRKAMEPLHEAGKLAGLVAPFPYAFRNNQGCREYIQQLAAALHFEGAPLQLDFRHTSWATESALKWMGEQGLGFVCVDEPELPGLLAGHIVSTTRQVLVRMHGRNAEAWWSGNSTTRFDYCYSQKELAELIARYKPLLDRDLEVTFLFQNHWQAKAVKNALQWKEMLLEVAPAARPSLAPSMSTVQTSSNDEDSERPPMSLPLSEVKLRVTKALADLPATAAPAQTSLYLPPKPSLE